MFIMVTTTEGQVRRYKKKLKNGKFTETVRVGLSKSCKFEDGDKVVIIDKESYDKILKVYDPESDEIISGIKEPVGAKDKKELINVINTINKSTADANIEVNNNLNSALIKLLELTESNNEKVNSKILEDIENLNNNLLTESNKASADHIDNTINTANSSISKSIDTATSELNSIGLTDVLFGKKKDKIQAVTKKLKEDVTVKVDTDNLRSNVKIKAPESVKTTKLGIDPESVEKIKKEYYTDLNSRLWIKLDKSIDVDKNKLLDD